MLSVKKQTERQVIQLDIFEAQAIINILAEARDLISPLPENTESLEEISMAIKSLTSKVGDVAASMFIS